MVDLLKTLLDPNFGAHVTLWSENSTAVAGEIMEKLMHALSAPPAHTAPLGIDHMFIRDNGKRKEKRLEYFARDPKSILLIDYNELSEVLNQQNTVTVPRFVAQEKSSENEDKTVAAAAPPAHPDIVCAMIKALVARVREDTAAAGSVNVPRSLARLRADVRTSGFDTSAEGLHAFLQKQVEEEAEIERDKRETGLGGALRRAAASSAVLRSKATTVEAAARRPFRDPAVDTGDNSLLARKVREATARALGGPPPQ